MITPPKAVFMLCMYNVKFSNYLRPPKCAWLCIKRIFYLFIYLFNYYYIYIFFLKAKKCLFVSGRFADSHELSKMGKSS